MRRGSASTRRWSESCSRPIALSGFSAMAGPLARRFGANTLTAAACAAGALSTLAYGLTTDFRALLIARLLWGSAYGVLNVTNTAYAFGDGRGAGTRIGISRAVSTLSLVVALGAGGFLVTVLGPPTVIVVY